jgi:regulator of replication initiation timing
VEEGRLLKIENENLRQQLKVQIQEIEQRDEWMEEMGDRILELRTQIKREIDLYTTVSL